MKQVALLTVADLLNAACVSVQSRSKKFPVELLEDFCGTEDSWLLDEFLALLSQELQVNKSSASNKIVVLMAVGSLGVDKILPVLLPHIRGNGRGDDTAERASAVLALERVIQTNPERVSESRISE